MVNAPQVSVLIPTFNYGRFLPEAIDSVLEQNFQDFELLVIDDCSSDDTSEVMRQYYARDPRIRFSANPTNVGMVNNWNLCLSQARGKYIKFLFGDDKLYHREALGNLVALLESHRSATLAASGRAIIDGRSRVVDIYRSLSDGLHHGSSVITRCLLENGRNIIGEPSSVLFRKADARRGFDSRYRQIVDLEMWFHLLEKGDLVYTREPLSAFRCHPGQQTALNRSNGIAPRECLMFFSDYAARSRPPREAVFSLLFHLRRWRRREPAAVNSQLKECEQRLIGFLGVKWRWSYGSYCVQYRASRPFRNLVHSIEKRVFKWRERTSAANRPQATAPVNTSFAYTAQ
jgi:glycosyltransferase involved in cell wall biosynthesis